MNEAGRIGRHIVQVLMLILSAFMILYIGLSDFGTMPKQDRYDATAPDVEVTLHPGMPQNSLINAGTAEMLDMLPGIGPVLAERIIEVREQEGPFFFPEDLMSVKGVGKKTTQEIISWFEAHPEMLIVIPPLTENSTETRNLPE